MVMRKAAVEKASSNAHGQLGLIVLHFLILSCLVPAQGHEVLPELRPRANKSCAASSPASGQKKNAGSRHAAAGLLQARKRNRGGNPRKEANQTTDPGDTTIWCTWPQAKAACISGATDRKQVECIGGRRATDMTRLENLQFRNLDKSCRELPGEICSCKGSRDDQEVPAFLLKPKDSECPDASEECPTNYMCFSDIANADFSCRVEDAATWCMRSKPLATRELPGMCNNTANVCQCSDADKTVFYVKQDAADQCPDDNQCPRYNFCTWSHSRSCYTENDIKCYDASYQGVLRTNDVANHKCEQLAADGKLCKCRSGGVDIFSPKGLGECGADDCSDLMNCKWGDDRVCTLRDPDDDCHGGHVLKLHSFGQKAPVFGPSCRGSPDDFCECIVKRAEKAEPAKKSKRSASLVQRLKQRASLGLQEELSSESGLDATARKKHRIFVPSGSDTSEQVGERCQELCEGLTYCAWQTGNHLALACLMDKAIDTCDGGIVISQKQISSGKELIEGHDVDASGKEDLKFNFADLSEAIVEGKAGPCHYLEGVCMEKGKDGGPSVYRLCKEKSSSAGARPTVIFTVALWFVLKVLALPLSS